MNKDLTKPAGDDLSIEIQQLRMQIAALKKSKDEGTLTEAGSTYLDEMTKKQFKLIEQKVLLVHDNAIQTGTLKKRGKEKTYYQTRLKNDNSVPRSYSYEGLIEKLYAYYFGGDILNDYSFKSLFELALDEKVRTEAPKEKTIRDYESSYKAFITDEFGSKDIRYMTKAELMEYMQVITQTMHLTKKRFYKFKGVLNLAFRYAASDDHGIIQRNIIPEDNTPFIRNCNVGNDRP